MFKLLIKLAIVALLANAVYRVGSEYLTYVRFRDAVRDAAMFKATSDDDLRRRIMALSADYDIPLEEEAVTINREQRHVVVQGEAEEIAVSRRGHEQDAGVRGPDDRVVQRL